MPDQEILQASARFIQKLISQKEDNSIKEYIGRPTRFTSNLFHVKPKKKMWRTALEHHSSLYNQMSPPIKYLKPSSFALKPKKLQLEYKPPE